MRLLSARLSILEVAIILLVQSPVTAALAEMPQTVHEVFRHSISDSGGDIFFLPEYGNLLLDDEAISKTRNYQTSHIAVEGGVDRVIPAHAETSHGIAWEYDLHIPLVFQDSRSRWFKRGVYDHLAIQQDVAPTLAAVLGISAPSRADGRILKEAMVATIKPKPPRAILVIVQDQTGWQYLNAHPHSHPFIDSLLNSGANFTHAYVSDVDAETSIGHAGISTGAFPRGHGILGNVMFNPGTWATEPVFHVKLDDQASSRAFTEMFSAPTLSDEWVHAQNGKPIVFSFCNAERAAVAMAGHGSLFNGNPKTNVAYFSDSGPDAGTFGADSRFFDFPSTLAGQSVDPFVKELAPEGTWYDHKLYDSDGKVDYHMARATPAQVSFESKLVEMALKQLPIGGGDVTDLMWLNFKSTDYCGHIYGSESKECNDVLSAVDSALKKVVDQLKEKTKDDLLVVLTADHGGAPLPEMSGARRLSRRQLLDDLNRKFDHRDNAIAPIVNVTSSQIYLNRSELAFNGFRVRDVVDYLKTYKVEMNTKSNALADSWISKGKPKMQPFFHEVIAKDDLQAGK